MGRARTGRPETVTLTISDGDTLTVKRRMTRGEQVETFDVARAHNKDFQGALVAGYLLDWTVADDTGEVIAIRGKSLEEIYGAVTVLWKDDFEEIYKAIEAHETAMSAEKNRTDGAMPSPTISPSPSAVVGALTGSAT